jgi:hypothetical protein
MPLFRKRQILAHRIKVGKKWFTHPRTDFGIYQAQVASRIGSGRIFS